MIERQLEGRDRSVDLLLERARILQRIGARRSAIDAYLQLLMVDPADLTSLNNLGNLLLAEGEIENAREALQEAVLRHPNDAASYVNLGNVFLKEGRASSARTCFEDALKIDPGHQSAHAGLAFVFTQLEERNRSADHRRAAFQGRCVIPIRYNGSKPAIQVLELISLTGGNTRLQLFLSNSIFERNLVAAEFYNPSVPLPPFALVVNAIGDADVAQLALAGAHDLVSRAISPVINHPSAIRKTGRSILSQILREIPGVITPLTMNFSRQELAQADAGAMLLGKGYIFPLLLRTSGCHGGENFVVVDTPSDLPSALLVLPGMMLIAIQFMNARAADGMTRKFRVMMIDGELYPTHLAIGTDWKLHYFNAGMLDHPERLAEDRSFMEDMNSFLGPKVIAALKGIERVLGLDYGGIDFGLNKHGDVLVFEANASMAVFPPGDDERWSFRRPGLERICRAVREMLVRRAGVACSSDAPRVMRPPPGLPNLAFVPARS